MLVGVAFDIPEPWGGELTRRRVDAGDPAGAHVPAHLTLLGPTEVDPERLPDIERHLVRVAAAHRPFPLHLRGTGTFRPLTQVVFVVVAAGISECEQLAEQVRSIPALERELRFPYHPHVTVAQDVSTDSLDAVYEDLSGFEARWEVDGFTLYEHGPEGRWRARRDFPLGGWSGGSAPPDGSSGGSTLEGSAGASAPPDGSSGGSAPGGSALDGSTLEGSAGASPAGSS